MYNSGYQWGDGCFCISKSQIPNYYSTDQLINQPHPRASESSYNITVGKRPAIIYICRPYLTQTD
jgi:hypothetical protein